MNALLNDEVLRRDFTALVANLKQHGVLFYKDKEGKEKAAPVAPAGRSGTKPYGTR